MLISLAEKLLLIVKMEEDDTSATRQLAETDPVALMLLNEDNAKKAFWINMYNAHQGSG